MACWAAARLGEETADVQVRADYRQGKNVIIHPTAQGRPARIIGLDGVVHRDTPCRAAARLEEVTADVQVRADYRQGGNAIIHPTAQGRPAHIVGRGGVVYRNIVHHATARLPEATADVQITFDYRQGENLIIHSTAESRPARIAGRSGVVHRDMACRAAARLGEETADVQVRTDHRQRENAAVHPTAQGGKLSCSRVKTNNISSNGKSTGRKTTAYVQFTRHRSQGCNATITTRHTKLIARPGLICTARADKSRRLTGAAGQGIAGNIHCSGKIAR